MFGIIEFSVSSKSFCETPDNDFTSKLKFSSPCLKSYLSFVIEVTSSFVSKVAAIL